MLVTLKNLEKETFQIDIETSCTVKELKEKVERDKGANYAAPLQKLIYSGKILQDEEVESCNSTQKNISKKNSPSALQILKDLDLDEKKFIVCLVTKPKVPAQPAAAAVSASAVPVAAATPAPVPQPPAAVAAPPAAPAEGEKVGTAESTLLTGPAYDLTVQNIVSMGYPESQVYT
jgi:UV excision repair protein RAD23